MNVWMVFGRVWETIASLFAITRWYCVEHWVCGRHLRGWETSMVRSMVQCEDRMQIQEHANLELRLSSLWGGDSSKGLVPQ